MTTTTTRFATTALGAAVATFVLTSAAQAQVVLNNTYLPAAELTRDDAPDGQPAEMSMNILDVGLEVPVYIAGRGASRTVVSAGVAVRRHSFDLQLHDGSDDFFPTQLYAVDGSLAAIKPLGGRWSIIGFGTVGLHTDFHDVGVDHVVAEGGGFVVRRVGDNLQLGLGPVLTYAFGKPLVLPAPFIRYQGDGKLSIETRFPRYVKAAYALTDDVEIGAAARSLYNNYRIGDERAQGADGESPVVVFSDLTVGVESAVRLTGPIWLTAGIGTTLHRTMTVNDDDGDELFDRGMQNGLVLSAGFGTRM